ncbi:L-arabinolactonase [Streptomyces sp. ADI96-02]|uniref:SMP-30/gluconolactonase/LRE family protein n=1 Tax=unclassified Streptomyces TaxID=2593676 RepID=UPI000F995B00|nr:SMP-30/gluconolactonase/LRE family protein [Streptomyces sp. ADI96-02]RPK54105.1 L-arabinolactonase [Streptomyces sp. ADI96-02]
MDAEVARTPLPRAALGESPRYDARTGTLSWVDLIAGRLWLARVSPDAAADSWAPEPKPLAEVSGPLSCAVRTREDGWLLAAGGVLLHRRDGGATTVLAVLEGEPDRARLNDGAVDAEGRLWVGSMSVPRPLEPWGRLHRVDGVGASPRTAVVREGMTAANGIGWSPDGATMYVVDSGDRLIHRMRAGAGGGMEPAGPPLAARGGVPDGMAVDDEGCLWVALWDGGAVVRLSPRGRELRRIALPCSRPAACALVGSRLVVTTAAVAGEPASGWTYAVEVGVPGPAAHRARTSSAPDGPAA